MAERLMGGGRTEEQGVRESGSQGVRDGIRCFPAQPCWSGLLLTPRVERTILRSKRAGLKCQVSRLGLKMTADE